MATWDTAGLNGGGEGARGVIFSGRPVALGDVEPELDAILLGHYGSQFGTRAVADVLTGAAEPRGRLPYTVPRSSGQVPIHVGQRFGSGYRRREGDPHGGYVDESAASLIRSATAWRTHASSAPTSS